jgi:hypothetical protein
MRIRWHRFDVAVIAFWLLGAFIVGKVHAGTELEGSGYRNNWPGNLASLEMQGQVLKGGATVDSHCAIDGSRVGPGGSCTISSGTVTISCAYGPIQFLTNNGAFTLAAQTSDSSCLLMTKNGASAGTINFSGFSASASANAALTTTSGNLFTISTWRVTPGFGQTAVAGYSIVAHQ